MLDWKLKQIEAEFASFVPPHASFAGGCHKTCVRGWCVMLRPDGTVGKKKENCGKYEACKGYEYNYN
jgi:hypothetical protein